MAEQGPPIEQLTRRLAETPDDFLSTALLGPDAEVRVAAVVSDLVEDLGATAPDNEALESFRSSSEAHLARLQVVLIASWLLHDPWFRERRTSGAKALSFLSSGVDELARVVAPDKFVTDPDRREELARLCLRALDLVPAGESEVVSRDRLTTLNSVERQAVLSGIRAKEAERRRAIQEAMQKKAAQEASTAWGHE